MKSYKKVIMFIMVVCLVFFCSAAYATSGWPTGSDDDAPDKVVTIAKDIWANVSLVVQILSIGAIVFAGVRYMFASSDVRANIKHQTIYLALGALLVFGSLAIISFVVDVVEEII